MEQHPIPRQITTFEFKLIGFMTIKQFIYLVLFFPLGFIIFKLFPVPILNILLGLIVASLGVALAFVPINDRPMEVWIRNFLKKMNSPTQYFYLKSNQPLYFLKDLVFSADPHRIMTHIESQEKLKKYLDQTRKTDKTTKRTISPGVFQLVSKKTAPKKTAAAVTTNAGAGEKKAFFTGIVKNHKMIPLPGILIYVKDEGDKPLRLLKSNPNGVFATFNPLPAGEYFFDFKDPRGTYFFDKMKIRIENENPNPLEFFSKELL